MSDQDSSRFIADSEAINFEGDSDDEQDDVVEEAVDKVTSWLPLASESPDPERERVDAPWNEVEDEEELADKFVKRLMEKYRVYVDSPSDAPEGVQVQQGPSGAWFYYSNQTQENTPTKVYISSPQEAPEDCTVRGGPSGGYFYYAREHPRGQR
ncbi:hypothetical protein HVTV-2_gp116 [Haloarcula virus HVTV-2]|uniref:Uncharacterized protein n=1 Tax=Haloarcula vallismortis tailed virus 1 TaxID=1262528 RepID=L7TKH6_9CAUD|nr:hypothetical protein HVTV1_116 [Haloarcula vallismortis tailed virus 1]AGC34485.1 hypothetical protein HVTV1_116 [Haloarcula vallismortis tailed virus 1]UBF22923.1 hypothetical protein HVTV-2_gp116 [Haloarcula virus HVTV-2]